MIRYGVWRPEDAAHCGHLHTTPAAAGRCAKRHRDSVLERWDGTRWSCFVTPAERREFGDSSRVSVPSRPRP